jgi:hypothetical protein
MRALGLLLVLLPGTATAGEVVHQLSPEAREAAIEQAARQPERNPLLLGQAPERAAQDRSVHGQIGFGIGTGGMREVFGSTLVPLGEHGSAAFSFSTGRYPGLYADPFWQPGLPWGLPRR